MTNRLWIVASILQTAMFVALILLNARTEDRLLARLAAIEVVLSDVRLHNCEAK